MATVVLDGGTNPFWRTSTVARRRRVPGTALFTLARHRQLQRACARAICSRRRRSATTSSNAIASTPTPTSTTTSSHIYQRLFDLVSRDVPVPDLVIYLQAPADLLKRLLRGRARREGETRCRPKRICRTRRGRNHFFFHYSATPLLVIETSHVDLGWGDRNDRRAPPNPTDGQRRAYVPR
jgi:deoxyadenosine/deoxycytidine kinase